MHLTVTTEDKQIYLETNDAIFPNRRAHTINDNSFWNSVDSRIIAIQYHSDGLKQIEYKNPRQDVVITDISTVQKFIDKFNQAESLYQSQLAWDSNNIPDETFEQKITRLGQRP